MIPSTTSSYWTKYQVAMEQNTFGEISFEMLKNIRARSTAFKIKSAEEPHKTQTSYQKHDDNDCQEQKEHHNDPHAKDLTLYGNDADQQINDSYQMEGCSRRTERINDYLNDHSDIDSNQLILARLADKNMPLLLFGVWVGGHNHPTATFPWSAILIATLAKHWI